MIFAPASPSLTSLTYFDRRDNLIIMDGSLSTDLTLAIQIFKEWIYAK